MKNKTCFCGIAEHCGYQVETDMEQHDKVIYEQGYNKAIDDYFNELCKASESVRPVGWTSRYCIVKIDDAMDIAKRMKEGGIDG